MMMPALARNAGEKGGALPLPEKIPEIAREVGFVIRLRKLNPTFVLYPNSAGLTPIRYLWITDQKCVRALL